MVNHSMQNHLVIQFIGVCRIIYYHTQHVSYSINYNSLYLKFSLDSQ